MLDLMGPPGLHHKFVAGIGQRLGVRFLARKSGSWNSFHSDSALVEHYAQRYALAALADDSAGEGMMRLISQIVDDVVLQGDYRH